MLHDTQPLWLVRTASGSRTHLATEDPRASKPHSTTLCGAAVDTKKPFGVASALRDVKCKSCQKGQRIALRRGIWENALR